MKSKLLVNSAVVGIIVGIISTYPIALNTLPSLIFWGAVGVILGLFSYNKKEIIGSGLLYGIFLSITFLFSRFGGTTDKLIGYSIFVAISSIIGAIAGIVTVFIGSKIRMLYKKGT